MMKVRSFGTGALAGAVCLFATAAMAQSGLRPAVGNPLARAKSLMAGHSYAAAMAQVIVADRQKNKTPDEVFVISEMRGAIAQASGDVATASHVFQQLIDSGRLGGAQLTNMLLAETSLAYQSKDYPGVISWAEKYHKAGGRDPSVPTLVIQAYYLQSDWKDAAAAQKAQIDQELAARRTPSEDQLQLLAACQKALQDSGNLETTMKMLVTYYPKPSYWADLIYALETSPGYSDRLELDIDRLKLRLGVLTAESDFMQMTQLALGENDAGQAQSVIGAAQDAHVFGTPAQAAREQRLIGLVNQTATTTKSGLDQQAKTLTADPATTSEQLLELGQNYASFKQYDKGVGIMQQAIAKGDLRRPALAQLRVGEALVDSGNKQAALGAFASVPATQDGTSDLAQLWTMWLKQQTSLPPLAH